MTLIALLPVMATVLLANFLAKHEDRRHTWFFERFLLLVQIPFVLAGGVLMLIPAAQWDQFMTEMLAADASLVLIRNNQAAGIGMLVTAVLGVAVCLPRFRTRLQSFMPRLNVASPVHTLALVLGTYLVGNTIITLTQGGLEQLADGVSLETPLFEVLSQQLAFVMLAFLGVGLLVRRDNETLNERLGLVRPTWAQVRNGLLWIPVLIVVQSAVGLTWAWLQPEQAAVLESINAELLGEIDTVFEWFGLALAAGLGEELLFRGALQPILGLWITSLLFAVGHVQYGVTPVTVLVFAIGLLLGIIRQRSNTTVAIIVHAGYNFVLGLLSLLAVSAAEFVPETAVIWSRLLMAWALG